LSGLHEHLAGLGELVSNLSKQFYQRFQTNIYITPKGSQGFKVHYDTHDVFVLQIHGKKTWKIFKDNPVSLPNKLMEFTPGKYTVGELDQTIVAEAGDLIYIPRGVMHQAETNYEMSIHVTLGMLGYTWTDLLIESILEYSKTNDALRKFLPRDMLRNGAKENFQEYFQDLFSVMSSSISLQESINRFKREVSASQKINIRNLLTQGDLVSDMNENTVFKIRQNVLFLIKRKGDNVVLEWQGKEVEFPIFMDPAIHFIAKMKEEFTLSSLPDCVDDNGKIVFVTRLIKEGLLSIKIN
jgi:ribosomal protein L16 Arg81 hydroxylase